METIVLSAIMDEVQAARRVDIAAYLEGALGDATFSRLHNTIRFGQADRLWLEVLQVCLMKMDARGWIYREGKNRNFWILETTVQGLAFERDPLAFRNRSEGLFYTRGFFDSEGGMPSNQDSRLYLQFAQKNLERISNLGELLRNHGVDVGRVHCPSAGVDPDYWRLYVRAGSHERFLKNVGSWHPRKRPMVDGRLRVMSDSGF